MELSRRHWGNVSIHVWVCIFVSQMCNKYVSGRIMKGLCLCVGIVHTQNHQQILTAFSICLLSTEFGRTSGAPDRNSYIRCSIWISWLPLIFGFCSACSDSLHAEVAWWPYSFGCSWWLCIIVLYSFVMYMLNIVTQLCIVLSKRKGLRWRLPSDTLTTDHISVPLV